MASSSLEPMRRKRISCLPALVSKDHFPFFCTIGIGSGQSSFPTERIARLGFFGSLVTSFFSRAFAANVAALFLSWTESSEDNKSSPSEPRISFKAGRSYESAALINASAASFEVANVFGADPDVAEAVCAASLKALEEIAATQLIA